jgi:nucleotide-binding universal stress UspA family protein
MLQLVQPHLMGSAKIERATILHPTDFNGGELAFAHALRISLKAKQALLLLRVKSEADVSPHISGLRRVVEVLVRWNMLSADAPASALVSHLDLQVSSVSIPAVNVRSGILDFLDAHPSELTVIATRRQKGLAHWLDASVEQTALRHTNSMILFLRDGEHGFVDLKHGEIKLRKVLVPIDDKMDFFPSIYRLDGLIKSISPAAELHFLHVGAHAPDFADREGQFRRASVLLRQGAVVDTIIEVGHRLGVDLIAMPTGGRHGLLGALRGSVTARILEYAHWPLLAVPLT